MLHSDHRHSRLPTSPVVVDAMMQMIMPESLVAQNARELMRHPPPNNKNLLEYSSKCPASTFLSFGGAPVAVPRQWLAVKHQRQRVHTLRRPVMAREMMRMRAECSLRE